MRIILREILPSVAPLIITLFTLQVGIGIIVEAILSFVGLSVPADVPAWGKMIAGARNYMYQAPWGIIMPILAMFVTVLGFNLLGEGLRRLARSAAAAEKRLMSVLPSTSVTVTARIGGRKVDVLRDIAFELGQGEIIGLVGESGAGKSMIGRVISGLLPDNFSVTARQREFDGDDLLALGKIGAPRAARRASIAFIPQEPLSALNPVRTIGQPVRRASAPSRHRGGPRGAP